MNKVILATTVLAATALAETMNCAVQVQYVAQEDCDNIAAALASKTVMTPAEQYFATITYTDEGDAVATTCAEVAALTEIKACADLLTFSDISAEQTACIDTDVQGTNSSCAVAKGDSCATVETFVPVCDADLTCESDVCTAATVATKYAFTAFTQDTIEDLQAKLDEQFKAADEPETAQDDEVNACEGITVVVSKFYPSQKLAIVTASDVIPAACITQVADTAAIAVATADQETCETTCGSTTCACEAGMECVASAEATEEVPAQGNCVEGELCIQGDEDKYTCNSSLVASAAFAVAAAVLAVMF